MLLVATADLDLAQQINSRKAGTKIFALSVDRLRELARREQPKVIALDVRLGGSGNRVVELIPELLQRAPCAEVVVMSPTPSAKEIEELNTLGAYGVANTRDRRFLVDLVELIALAERRASQSIVEARARRSERRSRGPAH